MGRELQKKKRRSGRQPVRQPNRPKKPLNPLGNTIIAANWNKKETLAQNYRRLGLISRLKAPTGGTERILQTDNPNAAASSTSSSLQKQTPTSTTPFGIQPTERAVISEARVERDADGKITRVIRDEAAVDPNPLNDPLNRLGDGYDPSHQHTIHGTLTDVEQANTDVVRSLLEQSAGGEGKKPRHVSEREREWLGRLVARHGDDYAAMARDFKLNPMQQTAADIKKRIKKMNG